MTHEQPPGAREWIKCSDECPPADNSGPYLVYRPGGDGYSVCIAVSYYWEPEWSGGEYIGPHAVTHWMPLPEPPTRTEGKGG